MISIQSWNSAQRLIPLGMLVSNIGNGMYLLATSVLMYQRFGGASTFAWLLILQSIAVVVTQALASVGADVGHSKSLATTAELVRGVLVLAGAVAAGLGHPSALFIVGLLLAFVQPFYRTPIFAIGPLVAKGDALARYNARTATFQQVGQFIGAGSAGILMNVSVTLPLYLNGVSYIFSGLMVALSLIPGQSSRLSLRDVANSFRPTSVSRMWVSGVLELWKTQTTLRLTALGAIDFLVLSWLNTIYAPLLAQLNVGRIWVSWWDTAFACGALLGANLVGRVQLLRNNLLVIPIILLAEGTSLLFVGSASATATIAVMTLIGIFNAISVALFTYFIQVSAEVEMAGRSSGLRQLAIAVVGVAALPFLSHISDNDVALSSQILCGMLATSAFVSLLALRGRSVKALEEVAA